MGKGGQKYMNRLCMTCNAAVFQRTEFNHASLLSFFYCTSHSSSEVDQQADQIKSQHQTLSNFDMFSNDAFEFSIFLGCSREQQLPLTSTDKQAKTRLMSDVLLPLTQRRRRQLLVKEQEGFSACDGYGFLCSLK